MRHGTLCAHDRYGGTDNRLVVCLVEDRAGDGTGLCRHGQNPDEQTQEEEKLHLRNETERIVLSLHSGWEEHRQASLQVKAETQVLKETERKWEEGLVSVFQLMEARNRLLVAKAEKIRVRLQYELTSRLTMYYRTGSFINH